jgi:hypothetical protein
VEQGEKLSRILLCSCEILNFYMSLRSAAFGTFFIFIWEGATLGRKFDVNIERVA